MQHSGIASYTVSYNYNDYVIDQISFSIDVHLTHNTETKPVYIWLYFKKINYYLGWIHVHDIIIVLCGLNFDYWDAVL